VGKISLRASVGLLRAYEKTHHFATPHCNIVPLTWLHDYNDISLFLASIG